MTKLFFSILLITSFAADDVYNINFRDISGKTISMRSFQGKKIVVVTVNAKSPDISYMRYLNSMQKSNTTCQIIIIPGVEFSGMADPQKIGEALSKEKLTFLMTQPSELKRSAKSKQHPLMAWITDKERNQHFEEDLDVAEKIFIINETGILYAVLDKTARPEVISNTLLQVIK